MCIRDRGCDEVYLYGGTGGKRLDHTLANLQSLLYLRRRGARGYMYDDDFLWTVMENESLTIQRTVEWGLFSAFSLGDRAEGIDETGFQSVSYTHLRKARHILTEFLQAIGSAGQKTEAAGSGRLVHRGQFRLAGRDIPGNTGI